MIYLQNWVQIYAKSETVFYKGKCKLSILLEIIKLMEIIIIILLKNIAQSTQIFCDGVFLNQKGLVYIKSIVPTERNILNGEEYALVVFNEL